MTRAFFLVGDVMYVDWLEARVSEVSATTRWHRWAVQALEEDLRLLRRRVAERVLTQEGGRLPVDEAVETYLASQRDALSRLRRFMRGLAHEEASDLAALTVAVRQVRSLSG